MHIFVHIINRHSRTIIILGTSIEFVLLVHFSWVADAVSAIAILISWAKEAAEELEQGPFGEFFDAWHPPHEKIEFGARLSAGRSEFFVANNGGNAK